MHVSLRSHDHFTHSAEVISQGKQNYEQAPKQDSKQKLHEIEEEGSNASGPAREYGTSKPSYTNI